MNEGVIAARYAKALLKYVQESGAGEEVYSQACLLVQKMQQVPQFSDYVRKHPEVDLDRRLELIEAALETPLSDGMKKFVTLVYAHKRMPLFLRMLYSFIDQYRQNAGIKVGRLVSAEHVPGLRERLEAMLSQYTGAIVQLEEDLRPDLLGGFIVEIDGMLLDASVREQIRRIRRELIDKNNRIV